VIFVPKSESKAVKELHNYLYDNMGEFADNDFNDLVGYYEELDREFVSMQNDMESVEEQVEVAEEELEELKEGLKDLLDNKAYKKADILKEIERLLF
jgi:uncharacterized protein with von Willebrand factor type A (vWA) domain